MDDIYLSVVIPAFNEASRIGSTLDSVLCFLSRQPYTCEVVLTDDGSTDSTVPISSERLSGFPHQILTAKHQGKGQAVKQGMLAARGRYCLFTDADLSTPIDEVNRFLAYLGADYDVVIGSRALKGANIEVHQPRYREWMGRVYNRLARLLTFHQIRDSQCGFKCFKQRAAQDLFSRQRLDGFSFDAEIIFLAQRAGYRLLEIPVTWRHSPQSRVNTLRDPLGMFIDLVRIRWIHRQ